MEGCSVVVGEGVAARAGTGGFEAQLEVLGGVAADGDGDVLVGGDGFDGAGGVGPVGDRLALVGDVEAPAAFGVEGGEAGSDGGCGGDVALKLGQFGGADGDASTSGDGVAAMGPGEAFEAAELGFELGLAEEAGSPVARALISP